MRQPAQDFIILLMGSMAIVAFALFWILTYWRDLN